MKSRIFILSVQREFAKERNELAKMYKRHKSYPANPLLAYAMFLRKYVEQTGTGAGDIIARCREWGLPDPQWQVEDGEDFVMVMPRPQSSVKTEDWTVDKSVDWSSVRSSVSDDNSETTDGKIFAIMETNPRVTLEDVVKVLGFTKRGIEKAVKRLKNSNRLKKVDGKRFGHLEVIG